MNFIMEHENLTYPEALKWLAKKYNIEIVEEEETDEQKQLKDERESLMIVSGFALGSYEPAMPPLEDLPIQREVDPEEIPPREEGGKAVWRCRMCGYVHYDVEPPAECPVCFFPKTAFKKA